MVEAIAAAKDGLWVGYGRRRRGRRERVRSMNGDRQLRDHICRDLMALLLSPSESVYTVAVYERSRGKSASDRWQTSQSPPTTADSLTLRGGSHSAIHSAARLCHRPPPSAPPPPPRRLLLPRADDLSRGVTRCARDYRLQDS